MIVTGCILYQFKGVGEIPYGTYPIFSEIFSTFTNRSQLARTHAHPHSLMHARTHAQMLVSGFALRHGVDVIHRQTSP